MVHIGFIGSGNMASALMKSIINKGICDNLGITASDKDNTKLEKIKKELEVQVTTDNNQVIDDSTVIFLAIKPQNMLEVLDNIKDSITEDKIIVSIAAGVKIKTIEGIIGKKKIVRVMPNTPCLVGEMAAGFSPNKELLEQEIETIEIILKSSGKVVRIDESALDAVTGLSGSGPAYVARLIEGFIEAGVDEGLDIETAKTLSIQTFIGTAKLLDNKNMETKDLIDMVSSPNGTTVAGREILDNSDVKNIIKSTIKKAADRSRELGK